MKLIVTVSVAAALGIFLRPCSATDEAGRDLQSLPPTGRRRVTQPLNFYPDDVQIDYNVNLKCGACIRGNYIYCVNGREGEPDLHMRPQTCCQSLSNCP